MKTETFVLIKPDAVKRNLQTKIKKRILKGFENSCKKYFIQEKRFEQVSPSLAAAHYAEHAEKDFFQPLCEFLCSGPVIAMRVVAWPLESLPVEKDFAVKTVRNMLGAVGVPGTLRGDYGTSIQQNAVHAADSVEAAEREISLWCFRYCI